MTKRTLVIDLDRCTGCDSCIVACKFENSVGLGNYWGRVLTVGPYGEYPDINVYWMPVQCQQCENAACVKVGPTGASYRYPDNKVVLSDKEKGMGGQYCVYACPCGVFEFNAGKGVVEKCTLNNHLTAKSDGNENPDDSYDLDHAVPPCCHNCPAGARFYGDLDDPNSMASKVVERAGGIDSENVHHLPNIGDANPATVYILHPKTATWKDLI